jgi:cell division protein FtsB
MSFLRRRATLLLSAGILGLLALSAADPEGLRKNRRLEAQARRVAEENRGLARENASLRREIRALQGDPAALERAAREELGFVRPGEMVLQLGEGGRR